MIARTALSIDGLQELAAQDATSRNKDFEALAKVVGNRCFLVNRDDSERKRLRRFVNEYLNGLDDSRSFELATAMIKHLNEYNRLVEDHSSACSIDDIVEASVFGRGGSWHNRVDVAAVGSGQARSLGLQEGKMSVDIPPRQTGAAGAGKTYTAVTTPKTMASGSPFCHWSDNGVFVDGESRDELWRLIQEAVRESTRVVICDRYLLTNTNCQVASSIDWLARRISELPPHRGGLGRELVLLGAFDSHPEHNKNLPKDREAGLERLRKLRGEAGWLLDDSSGLSEVKCGASRFRDASHDRHVSFDEGFALDLTKGLSAFNAPTCTEVTKWHFISAFDQNSRTYRAMVEAENDMGFSQAVTI